MYKFSIAILLTTLSIVQFSCGTEKVETKEQLYDQVMEVHDAVMPKMADINRVKRGLSDIVNQDSTVESSIKNEVNSTIEELTAAEESMMDWMKEFKQPKEGDPDEKVIKYLNDEKVKISRVSDQMLESLENGTVLLEKLKESTEN